MNSEAQRGIDLEHVKLMIDVLRHMSVLSFLGLVLTANLAIKLFEEPQYKFCAFISIFAFFVCIVSSILSQFRHVDASLNPIIYGSRTESHKFRLPIALSIAGLLFGVIFLAAFVIINWFSS